MSSWSRRVKIRGLKSSTEVQLPTISGNLKKMLYSCLCTSFVSCYCVLTENRRKRQRCDQRSLFPSPSRITSRLLRRLECVARRIVASHCALMVVIICGKCGNNRSRTENITEWTRFSKSRSNDFEDIGHCQGSLYATHPLILMIICAKYDKNLSRTVDFFFKVKDEKCQKFKFPDSEKNITL